MFKKIISLLLLSSMFIRAEGECPTSIMSDLQEAGSHVYAAGKHLLLGAKHTALSIPPVIRAGEKCMTNLFNFIERYQAITGLALIAGAIVYGRYRYKQYCRATEQRRIHMYIR